MAQLSYNFQKTTQPSWIDESDIAIPFNRVNNVEKMKELSAAKIVKHAVRINEQLRQFAAMIDLANEMVNDAINKENNLLNKKIKATKGNFTWFNFNRTVKIEINVNETIKFDEAKIAAARELFDGFIEKNVHGTADVVRQLINTAFANARNGLDSKKVLSLMKFRSKIRDKQFQSALDLIQDSISRPSSKRYFRVWVKNALGEYENIELNFSSF